MENSNSVILIDHAGSDNSHAIAAWASTFLDVNAPMPDDPKQRVDALVNSIQLNGKKVRSVEGLLRWLMDPSHDPHTSPFRASYFQFITVTDIATHIQFLKHSVAMLAENAESARYKELKEDKFYLPADWLNYGDEGQYWHEQLWKHTRQSNRLYHACLSQLIKAGMPRARAKETARYFKTYNSQINSSKIFNFDGLMQVYFKRRKEKNAQKEISDLLDQMVQCVRDIPGNPFKYSLEAFGL
jgi:thymidylate synthase ThyX